jgi:esterase
VPKQQLRDNVFTLIGQAGENRKAYSKAEAQSIETPTLFIGGTATKGNLPGVLRALSANVPGAKTAMIDGAGHWMFEHAPERFSAIVTEFLKD